MIMSKQNYLEDLKGSGYIEGTDEYRDGSFDSYISLTTSGKKLMIDEGIIK